MNLRTIKHRHDARTVRWALLQAYFHAPGGVFDDAADDLGEWLDDEPCHRCHGDGRDPWNDYVLPCPVCDGTGGA